MIQYFNINDNGEFNMSVNLREKPFYLNDEDILWVEKNISEMTIEEKIWQLFSPIVFLSEENQLKEFITNKKVGGILYREGKGVEIRNCHKVLQDNSKIPLLLSSNLEQGGTGSAIEGTFYGKQLEVAASGNSKRAYELGLVAGREGDAVGVNLALAPVIDIDKNFRNPITNIRTYGDDADRVLEFGKKYVQGAREAGMAVTIKHFPGDGIDERDQHLLTSVNDLTCEEWDASFGKIYSSFIDDGIRCIMVGHIALPAYEEKFDGEKCEKIIPTSLSRNVLQNLLRKQMGYNGLVITDATPMVGFCAAMEREKAVPLSIEYGCDMFLFNKDLDEDFGFMMKGYESGLLSEERLMDALTRILGFKAAIGLAKKQAENMLIPSEEALKILKIKEHEEMAKGCADEAVTLVKDTQNLLPITPLRHKRILLEILGDFPSNDRVYGQFENLLTDAGFEVTKYIPETFGMHMDTVTEFKSKYDLVIYIGNIDNASNKTVTRINWHTFFGLGNNMPWFVEEVPAMFISVGNPYMLMDAPMIKTYINGYCNTPYVIDAAVEKILGKSEFKGINPVDPFCGRVDTRY